MRHSLVSAVVELDENKVIKMVKQKLENNEDPLSVLEQVRIGVEKIGALYEEGKYFIADLIMAGLIFEEVLGLIDFPENGLKKYEGVKVIFATVQEDIHDIGKNVTISLFRSGGLDVIDLGVDVPSEMIIEEIVKNDASILCLSGLITSSYKSMKETIKLLHDKGLHDKVKVIIGGNVNEDVKEFTGADYWTPNCSRGLEICEEIATKLNNQQ